MQVFACEHCHREFSSRRARGGHLKVHRRPRRGSQRAGSSLVQPLRDYVRQKIRSQVPTAAPIPPPQKQPNTSQELALVVSQPHPQQEILALPEPNTNRALVTIPDQQSPTSQQLSMVVSQPQPQPQQELLALPEPNTNTNSALVTVPLQQSPLLPTQKNAQDAAPVVLFRCCCGITEKIPQTKHELMERGTYKEGCFTLYVHELLTRVYNCINNPLSS